MHTDRKLDAFCEDHGELLCHVCHIYNHQKCSHVVLVADKVNSMHLEGDFKKLSDNVDALLDKLIHNKHNFENDMQCLERSNKEAMKEITSLRKEINDKLDKLETNTILKLETLLVNLRKSFKHDVKTCTEYIQNMTIVREDLRKIKDQNETVIFIKYRQNLDQFIKTDACLHDMPTANVKTITFNPD
ncbi:hypothetical protein DPMN_052955 [Dreissena polymorpha]|uniref:B box-type domain-containing protein n=1 Tax=Dreissena polymorpha TaxID=45954 RepID=A0A9D4HQA3_DREPO|nr:hypothetical protein DPMN_052955 [Dreissena polymorpha]